MLYPCEIKMGNGRRDRVEVMGGQDRIVFALQLDYLLHPDTWQARVSIKTNQVYVLLTVVTEFASTFTR